MHRIYRYTNVFICGHATYKKTKTSKRVSKIEITMTDHLKQLVSFFYAVNVQFGLRVYHKEHHNHGRRHIIMYAGVY